MITFSEYSEALILSLVFAGVSFAAAVILEILIKIMENNITKILIERKTLLCIFFNESLSNILNFLSDKNQLKKTIN